MVSAGGFGRTGIYYPTLAVKGIAWSSGKILIWKLILRMFTKNAVIRSLCHWMKKSNSKKVKKQVWKMHKKSKSASCSWTFLLRFQWTSILKRFVSDQRNQFSGVYRSALWLLSKQTRWYSCGTGNHFWVLMTVSGIRRFFADATSEKFSNNFSNE